MSMPTVSLETDILNKNITSHMDSYSKIFHFTKANQNKYVVQRPDKNMLNHFKIKLTGQWSLMY